jgi:hypothetical protein
MREVKSLLAAGATYGQVLTLASQSRVTSAALRQYHALWQWSTIRFSDTQRDHTKVNRIARINRVRRVLNLSPL